MRGFQSSAPLNHVSRLDILRKTKKVRDSFWPNFAKLSMHAQYYSGKIDKTRYALVGKCQRFPYGAKRNLNEFKAAQKCSKELEETKKSEV